MASTEDAYRKVTIRVPVEIWSTDPDGDVGKAREIAGAVGEVVAEYLESTIGVAVAATGETTVTEGWES
jgi:hypothetical protein